MPSSHKNSTPEGERKMRAAVIGVGAMGRHHVRIYNELEDVELVAVVDVDQEQAEREARRYRVPVYGDYIRTLEETEPDLVSVAVPTSLHCEVTLAALDAGAHVLVEKPIAASLEDGQRMIQCATEKGRVLTVGHIERFNPAVVELSHRLCEEELGRIFSIHARRLGTFPARIRDVGVTVDLATHELDIMRYLLQSEVSRLYAETQRNLHAAYEDKVSALLHFESGVVGTLEVDWLTPTKIRELSVTGECGMFVVNYVTQDLFFYENADVGADWGALQLLRGVTEGNMIRLRINKKEPLRVQLEAFVRAAGGEPVVVTGEDGLAALRLARALARSGQEHRVLTAEDF
jgi:UDP-N-acetylglucosamine 3-dehydrogenase